MTTIAPSGLSLEQLWMPFTANKAFKKAPRLLASAKGMFYTDVDGNEILDGTAGLWCVNAGHGREKIVEAIANGAATLDYAPGFNLGHPLSFQLASQLVEMAPGDLDHVFFTNSGSEAVDTALKIAIAYHTSRGDTRRTHFVGRQRGYHGVGFGGISVGGIPANRNPFLPYLMPGVEHLPHTHGLSENLFSKGQPLAGANLADALEELAAKHGGDTIAAVIVEPVAGSTGVLIPPVGYLERLREICDAHGILLIFDEVITGFGRLGTPFAADYFGVVPDLMTVAKGITNGNVPMGAVFVRHGIYDSVVNATPAGIEFFHGYTYSGHPLACAAGARDARGLSRREPLRPSRRDGAVLAGGGPLAPRQAACGRHSQSRVGGGNRARVARWGGGGAGDGVPRRLLPERRPDPLTTADIIALSPPLIIETAHIDQLVDTLGKALDRLA